MKRLVSMLLASGLVLGAVGCGQADAPKPDTKPDAQVEDTKAPADNADSTDDTAKDPVELNVWVMPNSPEPEADFMEVAQGFMDENPHITVVPTILDWGSAWTKMTTAATSGETPDVAQVGSTWVSALAAMGAFVDLEADYAMFGGEEAFVPATLPSTTIEGQGGRYGVPWLVDTRTLFYRKDACEAAGVNPETDFATWESFEAALEKLNGVEINGQKMAALGMPGKNDWNVVANFAPFIWAGGGEFLSDDLQTSLLNSPEARVGIDFYTGLATKGLMDKATLEKNTGDVEALFQAGSYATVFSGPWMIANLQKTVEDYEEAIAEGEEWEGALPIADQVGVALMPEGPAGRAALFGGSSLTVWEGSNHKEEAKLFIEYMSRPENQIAYQQKAGFLPSRTEAFNDEWVTSDPGRSVFKELCQYGKAYESVPGWAPAEGLLQKGISNVWDNVMGVFGEYSPELTTQMLDDAAREATQIYQTSN